MTQKGTEGQLRRNEQSANRARKGNTVESLRPCHFSKFRPFYRRMYMEDD